jgi:hypothetical protein
VNMSTKEESVRRRIEIQCNSLPILLTILAINCERTLVKPTCSSRCFGKDLLRQVRLIKDPLTLASLSGKKIVYID